MAKSASKPGTIHTRIVEMMKLFPDGISGGQIRQELEKRGLLSDDQTHLDRRKRELKKWFLIQRVSSIAIVNGKKRRVTLYKFAGEKRAITDEGNVNLKLRAAVIHAAHGRCQMCGRTIEKDGIKLVVDHRRPRDWGGTNDRSNLWAICDDCNSGKKAYFSSLNINPVVMRKVTSNESVHVRIGELLKQVGVGKRTPSSIIEVTADQEDWQKRLRELRYPVIGWKIDTYLYKSDSGKKQSDYILRSFKPWPRDPSGTVRRFEADRKRRNREAN